VARSPVLQIPNAAQLRLLWTVNAQLCVNVIGASHTGSVVFDQALANALGSAIKAAYTTNLGTLQTINSSLVRVGIRSLSSPHLQEWRDTGAAVSGSATGDPLPANTALCITTRTAQSGKSARGRIFLPGFSEGQNDANGIMLNACATAAVAFVTAVRNALTASGLTMAVLSRPSYEQLLERTTIIPGSDNVVDLLSHTTPKPGGFLNVTSVESRNLQWETQRRRVNGRGGSVALFDPVAVQHFS
jgi:hypothetical protein